MMIMKLFLILAGWAFFLICSPVSLIYLIGVTCFSYIIGIKLEKNANTDAALGTKKAKHLFIFTVILLVAILVLFKYVFYFTFDSIVIPLGLSYYSFMVIGYLTEVYRRKEKAEKDLINYALFVGFFPQVTAGPIGRSKELLKQYNDKIKITPDDIKTGLYMIAFGVMQKFIAADNIRLMVDKNLSNGAEGLTTILMMLCYSFVIYFDFAGYSLIAIGTGRCFGIKLMDNFHAPYLATSVADFWRRWHISLSTWFRDYVYIPLGGNRKGKLRRDINTMIVFILSGAWHGSLIGYWIWGGIHGVYLVVEKRMKDIFAGRKTTDKNKKNDPNNENNKSETGSSNVSRRTVNNSYCIKNFVKNNAKRLVVFILVSFAWVPFYAGGLAKTIGTYATMLKPDLEKFKDGLLSGFGMHKETCIICLVIFVLTVAVSLYQERHKYMLFEKLSKYGIGLFAFGVVVYTVVLLVGVYGSEYDASTFIYGGF